MNKNIASENMHILVLTKTSTFILLIFTCFYIPNEVCWSTFQLFCRSHFAITVAHQGDNSCWGFSPWLVGSFALQPVVHCVWSSKVIHFLVERLREEHLELGPTILFKYMSPMNQRCGCTYFFNFSPTLITEICEQAFKNIGGFWAQT